MSVFDRLNIPRPSSDLKSVKTALKTDSDPTPAPKLEIDAPRQDPPKNRQARQERTETYTANLANLTFPRLSRSIEPYAPEPSERDRHGRFKPGSSGNPKGPEIGIVEYIRLMTLNGREMVDFALEGLRGWLPYKRIDENGVELEWMQPVEPKARVDLLNWLTDRGYGKAVQIVQDISKREDDGDLSALTMEEKREYMRLELKRAKALPAGDPLGNGEPVAPSDPL